MAKRTYIDFPQDKIDIYKNKRDDDSREQVTNFALISLRRKNLEYSRTHLFLKALIIELNKKVKNKPPSVMANVIRFWLNN